MTGQGARDDEREALIAEVNAGDFEDRGWMVDIIDRLVAALARKHPEPEITDDALAEARAAVAELDAAHAADPYSTNRSWDAIKRCVRALRAVAGRVPVGEGEQR